MQNSACHKKNNQSGCYLKNEQIVFSVVQASLNFVMCVKSTVVIQIFFSSLKYWLLRLWICQGFKRVSFKLTKDPCFCTLFALSWVDLSPLGLNVEGCQRRDFQAKVIVNV